MITLAEFKTRFGADPRREDMLVFVPKKDDPNDMIFVFFVEDAKVGVPTVKVHGLGSEWVTERDQGGFLILLASQ